MNMHRKPLLSVAIALGIAAVSGCASQQPPMTPEQQEMARQMQQALIARMQAGTNQILAQQSHTGTQAVPAVQEVLSEQELLEKIRAVQGGGEPVAIERVRDGLRIGGRPYLDPEGEIINFSANALTGDIVYALKDRGDAIKFKYLSAAGAQDAVTIGSSTRDAGQVTVKSATGQTLAGNDIVGTSVGVLVTRQGSAFHYVPGSGVDSLVVPDGYRVAPMQKGDFGSTGYILIEKIPEEKGSLQELTGIFSSLGETVGLSEADGYMLLHAETGRTVKLDISIDDKDVYEYSNCKRQNDFVNKCADMSSYESIYRKDGSRNQGHYFWRVDWMQTPQGPFAVVQEAGTRKINVVNLESGVKATVLERTLGISSYNLYQAPDGTISINAQMGFSKQTIDDAILAYEQQLTQLSQN